MEIRNELVLAEVAIPGPAPKLFTYSVPETLVSQVRPGTVVRIDFRGRETCGLAWEVRRAVRDREGLKPVLGVGEASGAVGPGLFGFYRWIREYYFAPPGEVLRQLPASLAGAEPAAGTPVQDLPELTPEQSAASQVLAAALQAKKFSVFLLAGVTGSGKTVVYFHAIEKALRMGRSVLFLVPEIAITGQIIPRLKSIFPGRVAESHSRLTPKQRQAVRAGCAGGRYRILVGVRSALFAPLPDLGLVIVDEEHDASYQQEDSPLRYNARDAAVMRARFESATIILGSATPSLESLENAQRGKYQTLHLRQRYGNVQLPAVQVVDMREEHQANNWTPFSRRLQERMQAHLERGKQVILLLNRRGFTRFLLCADCGYIWRCQSCDVTLTYHKAAGKLLCHYCGAAVKPPETCPECHGLKLQPRGIAVQKVAEKVRELFPGYPCLRLDTDSIQRKGELPELLRSFTAGESRILIGTQMVAKGFDFPDVTLVGAILADTGLYLPDFRASERTFQMLTQVAGRAGRRQEQGEVIIQTYFPEDAGIRHSLSQDYEAFYKEEVVHRRELHYPPASRISIVRMEGRDEKKTAECSRKAGEFLQVAIRRHNWPGLEIKGPVMAPIYKLKNQYRYFILIKAWQNPPSHQLLEELYQAAASLGFVTADQGPRLFIEVDPQSVM